MPTIAGAAHRNSILDSLLDFIQGLRDTIFVFKLLYIYNGEF